MDVSEKIRDLRQFWKQIVRDSTGGWDSNKKEVRDFGIDCSFEKYNCKSNRETSRIRSVLTKNISPRRVCTNDSFTDAAFVAWLLCSERVYWSWWVELTWIWLEESHNSEFFHTLSRDGNQVHAAMHPIPCASKPLLKTDQTTTWDF